MTQQRPGQGEVTASDLIYFAIMLALFVVMGGGMHAAVDVVVRQNVVPELEPEAMAPTDPALEGALSILVDPTGGALSDCPNLDPERGKLALAEEETLSA